MNIRQYGVLSVSKPSHIKMRGIQMIHMYKTVSTSRKPTGVALWAQFCVFATMKSLWDCWDFGGGHSGWHRPFIDWSLSAATLFSLERSWDHIFTIHDELSKCIFGYSKWHYSVSVSIMYFLWYFMTSNWFNICCILDIKNELDVWNWKANTNEYPVT